MTTPETPRHIHPLLDPDNNIPDIRGKFTPIANSEPTKNGYAPEYEDEVDIWLSIDGQLFPVEVRSTPDPKSPEEALLTFAEKDPADVSARLEIDAFIDSSLGANANDSPLYDSTDNVLEVIARMEDELKEQERERSGMHETPRDLSWLSDITATDLMGGLVLGLRGRRLKKPLEYVPFERTVRPVIKDHDGKPKAQLEVYEFTEGRTVKSITDVLKSRRELGEVEMIDPPLTSDKHN